MFFFPQVENIFTKKQKSDYFNFGHKKIVIFQISPNFLVENCMVRLLFSST